METLLQTMLFFVDSIPAGTTFVANSVIVNGVARPGANPASSINLGSINASQTTVVRFQVRVTSNPLVNQFRTVQVQHLPLLQCLVNNQFQGKRQVIL